MPGTGAEAARTGAAVAEAIATARRAATAAKKRMAARERDGFVRWWWLVVVGAVDVGLGRGAFLCRDMRRDVL